MTQTPRLTDRLALLRNRQRATQSPALFLQDIAAEELQDRLSLVNRTFNSVAIVTGFPKFWAQHWPEAKIISDDDVLDLNPKSHDLVIHTMSLHWANDPVGQLIQCHRALQADGFFIACLFGGQTLQELRAALAEAEIAVTGGISPRVLPMAELRDLGGLLQRAGFALPVSDTVPLTVSYRDLWHLAADLRAMGETNAMQDRSRTPTPSQIFHRANEIYKTSFPAEDNRISATFELAFLAGWAPDASQPQPLRPGSATTRLADVLNTTESKL